jgi:hypothetical protein
VTTITIEHPLGDFILSATTTDPRLEIVGTELADAAERITARLAAAEDAGGFCFS